MNKFLCSLKIEQWLTYRFLRWAFRPIYGFLRWLFHAIFNWRTARRATLAIATLATLIAVLYAIENWRGRRAWEQLKREMEAQGERLDFAAFIPPVADDQNFAMAPIWRDVLEAYRLSTPVPTLFSVYPDFFRTRPRPSWGDFQKAKRPDLVGWQQFYRNLHAEAVSAAGKVPGLDSFPIPPEPGVPAEDVLIALSRFDEKLNELRAAARRPASRFPIHYEDGWKMALNHLGIIQKTSGFLQLRSLAELELGRNDAALQDVQLNFRLIDSIRTEPTLISQLVRISMCPLMMSTIWNGLASHRWTDAELLALEQELRRLNWLSEYDLCREFEQVVPFQILDDMRATRNPTSGELYGTGKLRDREMWARIFRVMPEGWFDQNKIQYVRATHRLGSPRADPSANYVAIEDWSQRCARFLSESTALRPYNFLAVPMSSWQPDVSMRFIRTEAFVRLARTACALERYRLAHESYPDSLAPLAPQFIEAVPRDVIGGGELKYRRTDDGRFVLYSIGWNGRDDGGEIVLWGSSKAPPENRGIDPKEGDWVWKYPAD
ncbi:MAG TPA: hypothetical protein VFD27_08825 [Chthoniobacteraceae bacterium]|jgi:hypothetical protein|nr:hypothetical protein [Chthoniobacteraceae bacterium]